MALNASDCADDVVTAIQGLNPDADAAELKPYWEAICGAIIGHFQANGEILPTSMLDSLGGAVTGTGEIS